MTPSQVLAILIAVVGVSIVAWLWRTHERETKEALQDIKNARDEMENAYEDPRWIRQMDEIRLMKSPCGNCGAQSWVNGTYILDIPALKVGMHSTGTFPAAIVYCESCGETHLFAAKQVGLVDGYRLNVRPKGRP